MGIAWMKARTDCRRLAAARALISILGLTVICLVQARPIVATETGTAAQSSATAPTPEETSIPVATSAGIVPMSQRKYDEYVKPMGHLPVMTRSYIFGHTIPLPKTDKFGNIHVPNPLPAAPPSKGTAHAPPSPDEHGKDRLPGGVEAPRPAREPARP